MGIDDKGTERRNLAPGDGLERHVTPAKREGGFVARLLQRYSHARSRGDETLPNSALPLDELGQPVVIRTVLSGGVWHVTRNGTFVGDYLAEGPARDAALHAARGMSPRRPRTKPVVPYL
jgi:hypothetical protein